jgi:hypothetical protein
MYITQQMGVCNPLVQPPATQHTQQATHETAHHSFSTPRSISALYVAPHSRLSMHSVTGLQDTVSAFEPFTAAASPHEPPPFCPP